MQRTSLSTPSHGSTDFTQPFPSGAAKVRLLTLLVSAALLGTAGCGSVSEAAKEPAAPPVQLSVKPMKFSSVRQLPGDRVVLSLTVTNTGSKPVEDLAVTLSGVKPDQVLVRGVDNPNDIPQGTDDLPNSVKRESWFIDDGPNHTPIAGGETWNAGRLEAGRTRTLRWDMSAITPGKHTLEYWVAGGLTDNAVKATSGTGLHSTVSATIAPPGGPGSSGQGA